MIKNSKSGSGLLIKAGLVGLALSVAATSAVAQRGSMAETGKPAAHAGQQPVNNLPNPYETQRNFGSLPDGRSWGSVSAVDIDVDGEETIATVELPDDAVTGMGFVLAAWMPRESGLALRRLTAEHQPGKDVDIARGLVVDRAR